jgi:carbonic anhydrase
MAGAQASWVHGSSVQIEREGYFVSKSRAGYGAHFRTHGKEWFHFAIPTPVIVDGKRASLKKVFVFYRTEGTAKITAVHLYDAGGKPFKEFDNLALSGDHSTKIDNDNSWATPVHPMGFGLGISVEVDFGPATTGGVPGIWFVTAGANFETK